MPKRIEFRGVYPIGDTDTNELPIRTVGPAVAYYTRILGFSLVSKSSDRALLARDLARIGLAVNGRDPEQASCYFEVSDIEALRKELSALGIEPSELREEQYGGKRQRIFFAQEPFGVCFCFGQTLS
jgi:lactoylglutathione lyase